METAWNIQSEWQIFMQTYQPKKPAGFFPPYSLSNHYPICSFPLKASADLSEEPTIRLISFLASFTTLQSVRHGFGGSGRVETAPKKAQEKHEFKIRVFLVRNCRYWKVWSSISILTVMSKNHSSWCSLLRDILLNLSMQIKYELCGRKKKMICKRQFLVHVVFTSW